MERTAIYQIDGASLMDFARNLIAETRTQITREVKAKETEIYLSPQQVAEKLNVDTSTLWRWAKRGYLCPAKIGGKNRYKLSDIEQLLKEQ